MLGIDDMGQLRLLEYAPQLEHDTFYDSYEEVPYYTWMQLYKEFGEVAMAKVMVEPIPLDELVVPKLVLCDPVEDGWHYV